MLCLKAAREVQQQCKVPHLEAGCSLCSSVFRGKLWRKFVGVSEAEYEFLGNPNCKLGCIFPVVLG